jgi:uncharacterized protein YecE (DUF72 family)
MKKKEIEWHIGCSGFHYREWKEIFYPKGLASNKWFEFYRQHFNTLESNVSFYRLPLLTTLLKWHDESTADFSFSVKAPRMITHYKKMQAVADDLSVFYERIDKGLQEKLHCVLFQFPPTFAYSKENLEHLIAVLNPSFNNVVEFRHISWWDETVYEQLQENGITFCNMSHPKFPDSFIHTSPILYFRFHGSPEIYRSAYAHKYLDDIIKKIKADKNIRSAYLYFNNTAGPAAIENARYIIDRM